MDLNQLARDLVHLLSETFPRTVSFELSLQDRLPPLLADQNQVQQIVLNLCVNARDAMPGGGLISLSTRTVAGAALRRLGAEAGRNYACLTVTDTGSGMPPEVRQRIFEPFFTTKPVNQGTGLGLAVVYGIVKAHHGCLDVESKVGVGSSFHVYIPLATAITAEPEAVASSEFPGGTESLLIVDDEESLRSLLAASLSQKGYHALTAASGLEAIELISDPARHFDAVMLDLNMPGASGLDVLKIIRLCRPKLRVMVISGHLTSAARADIERFGQPVMIEKPYRLDDVGRSLRQMLDARPATS
jgi:CheY-like chemotaxis protein